MKTTLTIAMMALTAGTAMAQVMIPDGTRIRVRLEENLSSETAELGQTVDFCVTQEVRMGDAVVIANGARATGSIVLVEPKRRLGRAGKLDFTIERVQMVDGNWLNVRYTPQKNKGKGNGLTTGILTAGIAVVFVPAAPIALLIKGKDATIIKGRTYNVFADDSAYVATAVAANVPMTTRPLPQSPQMPLRTSDGGLANNGGLANAVNMTPNMTLVSNATAMHAAQMQPAGGGAVAGAGGAAMLSVNANLTGADIEVDGNFVGNSPTTIQLPAGMHKLVLRHGSAVWEKDIQITGGTVTINATLGGAAGVRRVAAQR
jgi:hypothetical protein